jgi:hypothetical protein
VNLRMSSGKVAWSAVEVLSTGGEYWEVLLDWPECHVWCL